MELQPFVPPLPSRGKTPCKWNRAGKPNQLSGKGGNAWKKIHVLGCRSSFGAPRVRETSLESPWDGSTIPWAAQPQFLTPKSKGSRAFSHFSSKLSTSEASFPQNSPLTAQTHLDQPPKNIPKILMDIFGLESGGMAPTLSPPWDTRGAKFPGSGSAFPQAGHRKERKKIFSCILKCCFPLSSAERSSRSGKIHPQGQRWRFPAKPKL